jgi:phenylacetate-CoA ligase
VRNYLRNIISHLIRTNHRKEYELIKSIDSKEKLEKFKTDYLSKLLIHAYTNNKYYRKIFDGIDIINNGSVDLKKFTEIPLLTKDIIKQNRENLISNDLKHRRYYKNTSGGSTGEPLQFFQDLNYSKWGGAVNNYWYSEMLDVDYYDVKKVFLWGSDKARTQGSSIKERTKNWLSKSLLLNSYKMSPKNVQDYIDVLNRYKPSLIRGYASSLHALSLGLKNNSLKYNPKYVISSAETLTSNMRKTMEVNYGTQILNFYGSRETNNIAGECVMGLMHLFEFHNIVEVIDNNGNTVEEGEEGAIVVTNLHNYSMPFIRYEIGDMGILGPELCECGNPLPTLSKITGRISDNFVTREHIVIHGEYFTRLFYYKTWVNAIQLIQEEYDKVVINIVLNGEIPPSDMKDINDGISLVLGETCEIVWNIVNDIDLTPQGKNRYTISKVYPIQS